jgi:hypothetical protein
MLILVGPVDMQMEALKPLMVTMILSSMLVMRILEILYAVKTR